MFEGLLVLIFILVIFNGRIQAFNTQRTGRFRRNIERIYEFGTVRKNVRYSASIQATDRGDTGVWPDEQKCKHDQDVDGRL
ncbi:jg15497 [Pararge aegeria aegeria]|uniref:Jg15497 protein n=1 Tax=Pararge aegeria aegeria TaxID=348720 RepID=A0A8S4R7R8_9NEOP|nr:jg15497 [Pararge aegeria aegeria]